MELYRCQNSIVEFEIQQCTPDFQNVISLSENAIQKCRMRIRNAELPLIIRIRHAVIQFIKSSVKGKKAKLQFGMVMHCDPISFGGKF